MRDFIVCRKQVEIKVFRVSREFTVMVLNFHFSNRAAFAKEIEQNFDVSKIHYYYHNGVPFTRISMRRLECDERPLISLIEHIVSNTI